MPNPVLADGRRLYPRMLSSSDFQRRFMRLFREKECLYILHSPGLGYGLEHISSMELPESSRLLIFEPDNALFAFSDASRSNEDAHRQIFRHGIVNDGLVNDGIDAHGIMPEIEDQDNTHGSVFDSIRRGWLEQLRQLENRRDIHFCPSPDAVSQLMWLRKQLEFPSRIRRVRTIRFCTLPGESANTCESLTTEAEGIIQRHWQNHSTSVHMAHLWIQNALRNVIHHPPTGRLENLSSLFPYSDIILCGASPGLEAGIAEIRRLQRENARPIIAAVDTALPALLDSGIVPQIVFMLEAQFANMDDFICSGTRRILNDAGSIVIHDLFSHPPSVRLFPRRMAYMSRFADTALFTRLPEDIPRIPPLGSVGVAALYILLRYMDRRRIFISGLEFAFPPGKTHARGTPSHLRSLRSAGRFSPAAAWSRQIPMCKRNSRLSRQNPALFTTAVLESYAQRTAEIMQLYGRQGDGTSLVFPLIPDRSGLPPELHAMKTADPPAGGSSGGSSGGSLDRHIGGESRGHTSGDFSASQTGSVNPTQTNAPALLTIPPAPKKAQKEEQKDPPPTPQSTASNYGQNEGRIAGELLDELTELSGKLHRLLKQRPPADSAAGASVSHGGGNVAGGSEDLPGEWDEIRRDLQGIDFVWKFLPGQLEPAYEKGFLSALGKSMVYWIRTLKRLELSGDRTGD